VLVGAAVCLYSCCDRTAAAKYCDGPWDETGKMFVLLNSIQEPEGPWRDPGTYKGKGWTSLALSVCASSGLWGKDSTIQFRLSVQDRKFPLCRSPPMAEIVQGQATWLTQGRSS
jgi:hypothetical protein